jgi:transposase
MTTDMRSLAPEAKRAKRSRVIELRSAGYSYARIARLTGLSRTGVFDICKRHTAIGARALYDAPNGHKTGAGRRLNPEEEDELRHLIVGHTPDDCSLPQALWTRPAVNQLIAQRLGVHLPVRTLALYLARWGFAPTLSMSLPPSREYASAQLWLAGEFKRIEAASRAQGGEIGWAGQQLLKRGPNQRALGPAPRIASGAHRRAIDRRHTMIWSLSNKRELRWQIFAGRLDARSMTEFLRRLILGSHRRVFLIMDRLKPRDNVAVEVWLAENEDAIQAFHRPGKGVLLPFLRRIRPSDPA